MNRLRLIVTWIALGIVSSTSGGCQRQPDSALAPPPPSPVLATRPEPPTDATKIESAAPELGLTVENYPKVDGSTSTQPLLMMVACKILAVGYEWVHHEEDDSRQLYASWINEQMRGHWANKPPAEQVNRLVQTHGTGDAYGNLIKKNADLILAARLPSNDELKLAGKLGVELDARPVALDAFVFLLNGKNPMASLTIEQIREIYSGRIVNWKVIGGPDAAIRPYQRTRNSGSQELMQRLIMRERAMIPAPDLLTGALMSFPFLALDKDVHGIGYSVFYYQEFMSPPRDIKACAVDGVLPTSSTIRSHQYPLVTEVYAVVRRDVAADDPACRLRDWMLAPTGQSIVEESGCVPVREPSNPAAH
jgi:phosphate transport system substrate-binding protein